MNEILLTNSYILHIKLQHTKTQELKTCFYIINVTLSFYIVNFTLFNKIIILDFIKV